MVPDAGQQQTLEIKKQEYYSHFCLSNEKLIPTICNSWPYYLFY
jgi:hypothetical protein